MDQVGGAMARSLTLGSTDDTMFCHLCPNVRASAYCVDCRIYLCPSCEGQHKKYPTFKDHRLLTGKKMPSFYPRGHGTSTDDLNKCPDHQKEEIKFFCTAHDTLCCTVCTTLHHNGCQIKYIPDICNDYTKSEDYKNQIANFKITENIPINCLQDIDNCIKMVHQLSSSQVEKLRKFKALIIAYLEQREKELLHEIQLNRDQDLAALKQLQTSATTIKSELSRALTNVKTNEDNSNNLFVATKRAQSLVNKLQSALQDITSKTKYREFDLQRDPLVETLLKNKDGMAQLVMSPDLTSAKMKQQPDILVDGMDCGIQDMTVVTPDTLLVSKITKKRVQLVDSRKGEVLSEVQLPGAPGRMCLTDRNTAAVAMLGQKIQMIQVKDKTLTLGRVLTVREDIYGITSRSSNLVVSYSKPRWLEVISMEGKSLHQFHTTGKTQHFKHPWFMCTTPSETILISDWGTNKITKVDESLNILQTFTSRLLQSPHGITVVTEDQILVCSRGNHSLLLLQPSTNTVSTLLEEEDGIKRPWSLTYCPDRKKVYVALSYTNTIKVYQIT